MNETSTPCCCPTCSRLDCIHRNAFRRMPREIGGLGLCPGWTAQEEADKKNLKGDNQNVNN